MKGLVVFLTTVDTIESGRTLASELLKKRLAACVNIIPHIESHYWWKEEITHAQEFILMAKISSRSQEEVFKAIEGAHPYDCPEMIVLRPDAVEEKFGKWWKDQVKPD